MMDDYQALIKLGDMMSDGLHHEDPSISREYKKILKRIMKQDPKLRDIAKNM